MKLLLIEDNADVSSMIARYLKLKGYDCEVTSDGKEGLNQILADKFDITLLDLALPEFSGYDVLESLEVQGKLKERKIIVLTASTLTEEKIKDFEKRGVLSCLKKPISLNELIKVIQSCSKV